MKPRVLLTGDTGFIGQHLKRALKKRGYNILAIAHEYFYNRQSLIDIFEKNPPHYIFHLAAYGNMAFQKDADQIYAANLHALWNLLQTTKDIPYTAFINVSTSAVTLPHQTFYSATKFAGEQLVKAFVYECDKPIVNVRPFSVYGPGEADFRFIPTVFRSSIKGESMPLSPNAAHDWIYIDDLVQGLINAAENITEIKGSMQEFGTGISTTNAEVVHEIEMITGKQAAVTDIKALRSFDSSYWVSTNPSPSLPSYISTLAEGLKKYYLWYTKLRKEE